MGTDFISSHKREENISLIKWQGQWLEVSKLERKLAVKNYLNS